MLIRMKDWPIGIRVGSGFGFLILGMAAIAYVGWSHLGKVEENAREIYEESAIPGTELAKMSTDLLRYRNRVIQAVGAVSAEDFVEFTQDLPELEARINKTLLDYKAKQSKLNANTEQSSKYMLELQDALDAYWGLDRRTVEQVRLSWKSANAQEGERLRARRGRIRFSRQGRHWTRAHRRWMTCFGRSGNLAMIKMKKPWQAVAALRMPCGLCCWSADLAHSSWRRSLREA